MTESKVEIHGEKLKEKFEEKVKSKKEEETLTAAGVEKKEKPKKKVEVKKPVVSEAIGKGTFLSISFKQAVEICNALKGLSIKKAENYLKDVVNLKRPIRFLRYHRDTPHRKGDNFGAGRFPVKASKSILNILQNAKANAKYLNLDESKLYIKNAKADRALSKERGGRYSRVEITVAESKTAEKPKKESKKMVTK